MSLKEDEILPASCIHCNKTTPSLCLYRCGDWFCSDECHEEYHEEGVLAGKYLGERRDGPEFAEGTNPFKRVGGIEYEKIVHRVSNNLIKIVDLLVEQFDDRDYSSFLSFLEYYSDQRDGHFAFVMSEDGGILTFIS